MCRSKAEGGRRCGVAQRLALKYREATEYRRRGDKIPETLNEEISHLETEHDKTEEVRRVREEETNRKKAEKAKLRAAAKKEKESRGGYVETQVHITAQEHDLLTQNSIKSFLTSMQAEGKLDAWMDKLSSQGNMQSWSDWKSEHGVSPESYLTKHDLTWADAARLTSTPIHDSLRAQVRAPQNTASTAADEIIANKREIPEFATRIGTPGRKPTNLGMGSAGLRDKKLALGMEGRDLRRLEAIQSVYSLKRSDALRCVLLGEDPRVRRPHEGLSRYTERVAHLQALETARKTGETNTEFYERIINENMEK